MVPPSAKIATVQYQRLWLGLTGIAEEIRLPPQATLRSLREYVSAKIPVDALWAIKDFVALMQKSNPEGLVYVISTKPYRLPPYWRCTYSAV